MLSYEQLLAVMVHLATQRKYLRYPKRMKMPAMQGDMPSNYSEQELPIAGSFLPVALTVCSECNIGRMTLNLVRFSHLELPYRLCV